MVLLLIFGKLAEIAGTKPKYFYNIHYSQVNMINERYHFSPQEIQRYKAHGIARASLNEMSPVPLAGCSIDLGPLLEIEQPKHAWVKKVANAPRVILASEKAQGIPESAIRLDANRILEDLVVKYSHPHPILDYTDVELQPIYKD